MPLSPPAESYTGPTAAEFFGVDLTNVDAKVALAPGPNSLLLGEEEVEAPSAVVPPSSSTRQTVGGSKVT
jgi:hypothetical protein